MSPREPRISRLCAIQVEAQPQTGSMKVVLPSTIRLDVSSMDTEVKRKREEEETYEYEEIVKRLDATREANRLALEEIKQHRADTLKSYYDWVSFDFQREMDGMIRILEGMVADYSEFMGLASAPMELVTTRWETMSKEVYENINDDEEPAVKFIVKIKDFLVNFIESTKYNEVYTYIQPGEWNNGSGYKGKYGV